MKKFHVFNTMSQAVNFAKRQKSYTYSEGCGCCGSSVYVTVQGNRVIKIISDETAGSYSTNVEVLGRIKVRV